MSGARIEVTSLEPAHTASPPCPTYKRPTNRNWSLVLGVLGTLTLHGVALNSVVGSDTSKPGPEKLHSAGLLQATPKAAAVAELVLIAPIEPAHNEPGLNTSVAKMVATNLKAMPSPTVALAALPSLDLPDFEYSSALPTPDEGDAAERALLFGRYTGQIDARIERIWEKPQSPIHDTADTGASQNSDLFSCQVQIRQDARGNVLEVLLLRCDASEAWRESLVVAINQASPLPDPPIPAVFASAINMTFTAQIQIQ